MVELFFLFGKSLRVSIPTGSIKMRDASMAWLYLSMFQFQLVRLKLFDIQYVRKGVLSFNSNWFD